MAIAVPLALNASPAAAAITATTSNAAGATAIANTLAASPATVTGASYDAVPPSGTPNGTSNSSLTGFPTLGPTFGILTSGDVNFADDANNSGSTGVSDGGGAVRGTSDRDVTILKASLNVPSGTNCLGIDFRFLSDEFPEFVGSGVSDSFVAEVDTSDWTTTGGSNPPTAPNNFAFDEGGNPISINSTGSTGMSAAQATGTTYDGATKLLSANSPITPGSHTLYLSIFDQGDNVFDSAVFLDNLRFAQVANPEQECQAGAAVAGKISARGTVHTTQGPTIGFSAANNCNPSQSTRPSIVGTTAGARIWTKSTVSLSSCTDQPPASTLGFDTQTGTATGTFGPSAPGGRNGQQGTLQWTYHDNSPDTVQFTLKDSSNAVVFQAAQQTPAPFRGSPGGVWTSGP